MTRNHWLLIFGCLAGGMGALHFGFALEWDLLNYHLYNPHALVSGRQLIDVAPAQQQSFLNPALHLPMYLVFRYLDSAILVFVTGLIQGSQLLLLVLILEELTGRRLTRGWLLFTVAVTGLFGPIFLNQLGGSQGDTVLSVFVLSGLLMVLRELSRSGHATSLKTGVLSGLLLGMACGLKLTIAIYAIGLALAAFICFSGSSRWRIVFGMGLGGLLGVAITGGVWFFHLWQTYESPLFPFFNSVFASPWMDQGSYRDTRFLPQSLSEWLFYPAYWLLDPYRVWEFRFRDIRVPLLIAAVFIMPLFAWRRMREQAPALGLVWLFLASSYLLWIRLFSIYRYLSIFELLAPAVIFSSVFLYVKSRRGVLVLLLVLIGSQALVAHHRNPSSWEFQAHTATVLAELPSDAMVLIDGYEPLAYAALWIDDDIPLVRIRANFMSTSEPQHRLHAYARQAAGNHGGSHFLLLPGLERDAPYLADDLARAGLVLGDIQSCRPVYESEELQKRLDLFLCKLGKVSGPANGKESGGPARN